MPQAKLDTDTGTAWNIPLSQAANPETIHSEGIISSPILPLLKASDVSGILNISRTTAYRLMEHDIPVIRFGSTVRVRLADLEAFIERGLSNVS